MGENDERLVELIKQHVADKQDNSEEICNYVYDEVYALVRPMYEKKIHCRKMTDRVLARMLTKMDEIDIQNVHSSIARNAVVYLYQMYSDKYGELFIQDEDGTEYTCNQVSDDKELLEYAGKYNEMFKDTKKYNHIADVFEDLTVGQMILYELFCYADTPADSISELLGVDESVILKQLYIMRSTLLVSEIKNGTGKKKKESAKSGKALKILSVVGPLVAVILLVVIILVQVLGKNNNNSDNNQTTTTVEEQTQPTTQRAKKTTSTKASTKSTEEEKTTKEATTKEKTTQEKTTKATQATTAAPQNTEPETTVPQTEGTNEGSINDNDADSSEGSTDSQTQEGNDSGSESNPDDSGNSSNNSGNEANSNDNN